MTIEDAQELSKLFLAYANYSSLRAQIAAQPPGSIVLNVFGSINGPLLGQLESSKTHEFLEAPCVEALDSMMAGVLAKIAALGFVPA